MLHGLERLGVRRLRPPLEPDERAYAVVPPRGRCDLDRASPIVSAVGMATTPYGPIALVLSGGGARGAYEIGALSVLLPALEAFLLKSEPAPRT